MGLNKMENDDTQINFAYTDYDGKSYSFSFGVSKYSTWHSIADEFQAMLTHMGYRFGDVNMAQVTQNAISGAVDERSQPEHGKRVVWFVVVDDDNEKVEDDKTANVNYMYGRDVL